jgi:hypothetical protein
VSQSVAFAGEASSIALQDEEGIIGAMIILTRPGSREEMLCAPYRCPDPLDRHHHTHPP